MKIPNLLKAIIYLGFGIFLIYRTANGQDSGEVYYLWMGAGILLILFGLYRLYKSRG